MTVFLRLHNPSKFGDHLNRFIDKEVVHTHTMVTGNELAKAGFAVRILRPFYDSHGVVTGYVELGEELGQFIHTMKNQTGNDYGLLLSKKFVDRQFWADSSKVWKRRDSLGRFRQLCGGRQNHRHRRPVSSGSKGDLAVILREQGAVLERFKNGNSVFVRGICPVRDAARKYRGCNVCRAGHLGLLPGPCGAPRTCW